MKKSKVKPKTELKLINFKATEREVQRLKSNARKHPEARGVVSIYIRRLIEQDSKKRLKRAA